MTIPHQDRRSSWLARPMTTEQAAKLKRLAQAAYDLDAFKPNLTGAEADLRIAALIAKLKVLDGRAIELWKLQPETPRFR
jgi:hypothetical protein